MLKLLETQEGKILAFGILLLFGYLFGILSVYLFSVEYANSLAIMTVTNIFFGRAAGISYGYSAEFSDLAIVMFNIIIEFITVLIIYPLFVLSWRKSLKIDFLHGFFSDVERQRLKYKDFFDKYGKYGLFIFVWFPFWMTGPVVGSIIGFLIGLKHYVTMLIVLIGTSLAIVIWTYFLKELVVFMDQLSSYAPYILLGFFVTIAVIFKVIKSRQ